MPGGKSGFIVSKRPREYPLLPQQQRLKEACEACGIVKGISRAELIEKMRTCIPEFFRKDKGEG